jgi:deoxyguanosine kinase
MDDIRYIAVEGPIGVGKTALARMFAEDAGARLVLEEPDENPFLPQFYQDVTQYAFQTQLFFLLSRYRQQVQLKQQDLFQQKVVCDYIFAKDHIFAQLNLTPDEMDLYNQIFHLLDKQLPKPDVVVFLQANPDVLVKRIKKRNKSYEQAIDPDYVRTLAQGYSEYFFSYRATPLLVVNTSDLDFVGRPEDYATLRKELIYLVKSGKPIHYVTINQN